MKKNKITSMITMSFVGILLFVLVSTANAHFESRAAGTVYDHNLDVTWVTAYMTMVITPFTPA